MAVGDAAVFYPIRPPRPGDATIQVADDAWAAVLDFPMLPADSMSSSAAHTLLQSFARFLVGGFGQLPPQIVVQLVVLQTPLSLGAIADRYRQAARDLAATTPGGSDVAWAWAQHLQSLETSGLARRRGAVVLTARRPAPALRDRLAKRGKKPEALGRQEAERLLVEAARQVMDAGHDVGFALRVLSGEELAEFVSLWSRGEALGCAGEEAVDAWHGGK